MNFYKHHIGDYAQATSRRIGDWAMWGIRLMSRLKPIFNIQHRRRKIAV